MTTGEKVVPEELRAILGETLQIGSRARSLTSQSPLLGAIPELDSLAVVNVLTAVEERFDIVVADDEVTAEVFESFGSLCAFVDGKLSNQAP